MDIRNISNSAVPSPISVEKSHEPAGPSQTQKQEDDHATLQNAINHAAQGFDHVISAVKGLFDQPPSTSVNDVKNALDSKDKDLQSQDKLDNTQIQTLMSDYNEAQTLVSNIQKKKGDADSSIIGNLK